MDDDIVVDLTKFIIKTKSQISKDSLTIGGWIHSGMKVRREQSKWALTKEEFGQDHFPDFASGWAYATNWRTAQMLVEGALQISQQCRFSPSLSLQKFQISIISSNI